MPKNFREAKRILPVVHQQKKFTIYCHCPYEGKTIQLEACGYKPFQSVKRARRLEWEHVVPAQAFGQSFIEWREGSPRCKTRKKSYKGRRCAETNPEFSRMEANLYNLFPEVGELNGMRSNFSMAELGTAEELTGIQFGKCKATIHNRKFEPMDFAKGTVARVYLYMESTYPGRGIISEKNQKLFEAWDTQYPVEPWECAWYQKVQSVSNVDNLILKNRCVVKR